MQKIKRVIALLLTVALLLLSLTACSSKAQEQKPVGSCAGFDVLYEELRYVTLTYKDLFEKTYGEGIWDDPTTAEQYRKELEDTVWSVLLNNYAVLAACKAHGMTEDSMYSDAIDDAIDQQIDDAIKQIGKDTFWDMNREMYITENLLRFVTRVAILENELRYILTDDLGLIENDLDAFLTWLEQDNVVYVQHVFIENDPGEDKDENRRTAESIRQQLLNGSKIDDFVGSAINEDYENTAPYFLVRDVYTATMEDAAFSLSFVGDVSRVVDVGNGYYVMVRLDYEEADLLLRSQDLLASYQKARTEAIVEEYKATLTIEKNEYGESIDLLDIK